MCGKFKQGFDLAYLAALLKLPAFTAPPVAQATPGRTALSLVAQNDHITARSMRWGFASAPGLGVRPIVNARAETLAEKPMFASAFKTARCALPVSSYLEGDIEVRIEGTPLFYLAGLYQKGADDVYEFSVITRAPTDDLKAAHDRMPLVLADKMTLDAWLQTAVQPAEFPTFTCTTQPNGKADQRQMALF